MSERDERPVVVVERGGLGSFFVGLLAGAAVALLFAPQSGEETRRTIRQGVRRVRDAAGDRIDDLQESISDRYERTRERIEDSLDTARRTVRDTKDAGKAAVHTARDELERRLQDARAQRRERSGEAVEGEVG